MPVRRSEERGEQRRRRKKSQACYLFCTTTGPVWYNREQIFNKKGEKIRQERGVGGPWRPNWVLPKSPLDRSFVISMTSLFPWTNAATAWRGGGGGTLESPGPGPICSNCGAFSRWRMESRARLDGAAHDRIPGGTSYYETNLISENKSYIKAYERHGRQSAPLSARRWRNGKIEGPLGRPGASSE